MIAIQKVLRGKLEVEANLGVVEKEVPIMIEMTGVEASRTEIEKTEAEAKVTEIERKEIEVIEMVVEIIMRGREKDIQETDTERIEDHPRKKIEEATQETTEMVTEHSMTDRARVVVTEIETEEDTTET